MSGKRRRILIIDDDKDTLANLSDILTEIGYDVETACSGQVALAKMEELQPLEDGPFDLCLLDFKMPGMDGVELLKQIQIRYPKLTAIMITAYAGDNGISRAQAAGTWKVLRKPVDIELLLEMIGEAVAN